MTIAIPSQTCEVSETAQVYDPTDVVLAASRVDAASLRSHIAVECVKIHAVLFAVRQKWVSTQKLGVRSMRFSARGGDESPTTNTRASF